MGSLEPAVEDLPEESDPAIIDWEGLFKNYVPIMKEHRQREARMSIELEHAKATAVIAGTRAETAKRATVELRRQLVKVEAGKNWLHAMIQETQNSHDETVSEMQSNHDLMARKIAELQA